MVNESSFFYLTNIYGRNLLTTGDIKANEMSSRILRTGGWGGVVGFGGDLGVNRIFHKYKTGTLGEEGLEGSCRLPRILHLEGKGTFQTGATNGDRGVGLWQLPCAQSLSSSIEIFG